MDLHPDMIGLQEPNRAFTVIEVIVVIAILIILAGAIASVISGKTYIRDGQSIRVIDGCEYITTGSAEFNHLVHKANCTNHIHSWNQ